MRTNDRVGYKEPSGKNKNTSDSTSNQALRRILLLVESEGAVFDTLAQRHENVYLPVFVEHFAWGMDPVLCGHLWRRLALNSRLRGEDASIVLLYALRLLNRHTPSVRRAAVIRVLETYLDTASPDPLQLASAGEGSPGRLILDWITDSERLIDSLGYAKSFQAAEAFLHSVKAVAANSAVLVYSSSAEAMALNQWEVAGLGDCFLRIAGSERGEFPEYVQMALQNGYDQESILIVGTTYAAWRAAQRAGTRLYPIIPSKEEESWQFLQDVYFPAFLKGETAFVDRDERDFVRMIIEDLDAGF